MRLRGHRSWREREVSPESLTRRGERHFLCFAGLVAPGAKHPLLCVVSWWKHVTKTLCKKGKSMMFGDDCISRQRGPLGGAPSPCQKGAARCGEPTLPWGVPAFEEGLSDSQGCLRLAPVRRDSACRAWLPMPGTKGPPHHI